MGGVEAYGFLEYCFEVELYFSLAVFGFFDVYLLETFVAFLEVRLGDGEALAVVGFEDDLVVFGSAFEG